MLPCPICQPGGVSVCYNFLYAINAEQQQTVSTRVGNARCLCLEDSSFPYNMGRMKNLPPEIINFILELLSEESPKAVESFSRVSTLFRRLALPFLWRSIIVYCSKPYLEAPRPLLYEKTASYDYARRSVRDIRFSYRDYRDYAFEDSHVAALEQSFIAMSAPKSVDWPIMFAPASTAYIARMKRLHDIMQRQWPTVNLAVSAQAKSYAIKDPRDGSYLFAAEPMEKLTLYSNSQIMRSLQVKLAAPSDSVEAVHSGLDTVYQVIISCPNLRNLDIYFVHSEPFATNALDLQDLCWCHLPVKDTDRMPTLESLRLHNYVWTQSHALEWERAMDWSKLQSLDIRSNINLADRGLSSYNMQFFEHFSGKLPALRILKTGFFLSGPGQSGLGYSTMYKFLEDIPSLEELSLSGSLYCHKNLFQAEKTILKMLLMHGSSLKVLEYLGSNVADNRTLWDFIGLDELRLGCPKVTRLSINYEEMGAWGNYGPRFTLGSLSEQFHRLAEKPDDVILALARIPQLKHLTIHTEVAELEIRDKNPTKTKRAITDLFKIIQKNKWGSLLDTLTIHGMSYFRSPGGVRLGANPSVTFSCKYSERDNDPEKVEVEVHHMRGGWEDDRPDLRRKTRWLKTYV